MLNVTCLSLLFSGPDINSSYLVDIFDYLIPTTSYF